MEPDRYAVWVGDDWLRAGLGALAALVVVRWSYGAGPGSPAPTLRSSSIWCLHAVPLDMVACVALGDRGSTAAWLIETGGRPRAVDAFHGGPGEDTPPGHSTCCPRTGHRSSETTDSRPASAMRTRCSSPSPVASTAAETSETAPAGCIRLAQRGAPLLLKQPQRGRHGLRLSTGLGLPARARAGAEPTPWAAGCWDCKRSRKKSEVTS